MQVPPSPPSLYVTSATSSSILMHWKNTGTGNAAVTAYTLHYKRHHGNAENLQLSRHASSHELKNLNCGTQYSIHLTTHNKMGMSLPSTTLHGEIKSFASLKCAIILIAFCFSFFSRLFSPHTGPLARHSGADQRDISKFDICRAQAQRMAGKWLSTALLCRAISCNS